MFRVCFLVVWIAAVCFAGKWSEWKNASLCTAKPCGCHLDTKSTCESGTKIEIRFCNHTGSDVISPCAYDEHNNGPIRKINCKAKSGENCPGWSEWKPITDCICEPYKEEGRQQMQRLCNNPAPIYGDNLCAAVDGTFVDVEKMEKDCTCTNIGTTTTTLKPEHVRLCCCEVKGPDGNPQPEPEKKGGLFDIRRRREDYGDVGDYVDNSQSETEDKGSKDPDDYSFNCITKKEDPTCCASQKTTTSVVEPTVETTPNA